MAEMTLYTYSDELAAAFARLDAVIDPATGEVTDEDALAAIEADINALTGDWKGKALQVTAYITELKAQADAIKAAEARMAARRRAKSNLAARLSGYLTAEMQRTGIKKIENAEISVSLAKKPQSVEILDEKQIPGTYWTTPEPVINKAALKFALKEGDIPGARLSAPAYTVRIR